MFSLSEDKIPKIISLVDSALSRDTIHIRLISSIMGNLVWAIPAFPLTQAHYRLIQRYLLKETNSWTSLDKKVKLPDEVKYELSWLAQNIRSNNGRAFFSADPEIVIYANASNSGWGRSVMILAPVGHGLPQKITFTLTARSFWRLSMQFAPSSDPRTSQWTQVAPAVPGMTDRHPKGQSRTD